MNFTARQISVSIVASWQGTVLSKVLYAARMEDEIPEEHQAELAKVGADVYAELTAKELELISNRYPRRRDVKWF